MKIRKIVVTTLLFLFENILTIFARKDVKQVLVYATRPTGKIVGEFEVEGILSLNAQCLWEQTNGQSGIRRDLFDKYFYGKSVGHAIKIGKPKLYRIPLDLKENYNISRPPQSFMYISQSHSNIPI